MKIRDEKLKQKASVPKKLEDGWEPDKGIDNRARQLSTPEAH
jgi:hypothetical protein